MAHFHSRQKKMTEEQVCSILSTAYPTLPRPKPVKARKEHGYQKRHDLLTTGFGDPLSNNTHTCDQQHGSYMSRDEFVQRFKPFYDRTGAIVPPHHTRPRVSDDLIIKGTPSASCIKDASNVKTRHNVFYDVRTGEIILVVFADSKADHFYTRYYVDGPTTFPHIRKMRGEDVAERVSNPPMMLIINDEPVFWGYAHELEAASKNPVFATLLNSAKHWWMQYQEPMIINPVTRPVFDLPRLRYVQMQESTIKRIEK